jgi:hypothetical protein
MLYILFISALVGITYMNEVCINALHGTHKVRVVVFSYTGFIATRLCSWSVMQLVVNQACVSSVQASVFCDVRNEVPYRI